jgi:dCMP deaminase
MNQRSDPDKWQRRFLGLTDEIAGWSKDPSRGVGAVIVSPTRQIIATGFNGLPRGLEDTPSRLQRPVKYDLTVHAELNAIIQCARNGVSPIGCTLYSSFSPCVQCAISISQSGITQVVTYALDEDDDRWVESIGKAVTVFEETGIEYLQFEKHSVNPIGA